LGSQADNRSLAPFAAARILGAMRKGILIIISTTALTVFSTAVAQASLPARVASALHIKAGGYAQKASEVDKKEGSFEYSNGAVDLKVAKGGRAVTFAGVACNTGPAPTGGLPALDEVTIKVPKKLPISRSGTFSYSGPVTLSPEDSQTEESFTTTYTIKGRFQRGHIAVTGTDSSPICRPGTVTSFKLIYDPAA
jgi:hypothetical protein